MSLLEVIKSSEYHRVVYENGHDLIVIARKGVEDHHYWLIVENVLVREDIFTNDEVAKEYYQMDDRDVSGYYNKKYAKEIAKGKEDIKL